MRIVHITSAHTWDDDRIFQRACVALAREGVDVTLIAPHNGNAQVLGVTIKGIKIRKKSIFNRLLSAFEAFNSARTTPADIYHFHDLELMPLMSILAFKRKVIFDIHEYYISRIEERNIHTIIKKFIKVFFTILFNVFKYPYSGIITVTESMKQSYHLDNNRVLVVSNLVDIKRLEMIKLEPKEPYPVLITSGTNSPQRNCQQTIEAMALILKEVPETQCWFLGRYHPPGYDQFLYHYAKNLGIGDKIKIMGEMPWEDNFTRISRGWIGLVFYTDNPNNRVTIPNRLFEYMFCGLAVLVDDFYELRKTVEQYNCGFIVKSRDPISIANAAIKMLKQPRLIDTFAQNARFAVLNELNFNSIVPQIINFYRSILENK